MPTLVRQLPLEQKKLRTEMNQARQTLGMTNNSSQSITVGTVRGQGPMPGASVLKGQDPVDTGIDGCSCPGFQD